MIGYQVLAPLQACWGYNLHSWGQALPYIADNRQAERAAGAGRVRRGGGE